VRYELVFDKTNSCRPDD